MLVTDAQAEVRATFRHGSVGQIVSGLVWLASAAATAWRSTGHGIVLLVLGGMLIFPLTQLALRALGGPHTLSRDNPLGGLAMQVAFTVPIALPVAGGAALHRVEWFHPAAMIIVGAHYLPFAFLYGTWHFVLLAGLLVSAGLSFALHWSGSVATPPLVAGAVLIAFGLWLAVMDVAARRRTR